MVIALVLLLAAAFGAGDRYLGSLVHHPWGADVASLSAPWLLLAFLAGATQRNPSACRPARARLHVRSARRLLPADRQPAGGRAVLAREHARLLRQQRACHPRRDRHRAAVRLVRPAVADAPRDRRRARRRRRLLPRAARSPCRREAHPHARARLCRHQSDRLALRHRRRGSRRLRSRRHGGRRPLLGRARARKRLASPLCGNRCSVWSEGPTSEHVRRLQAVTDAALAHLELDELLDALLERTREILDVDTCAILLLDEDDERAGRARGARDRGGGRAGRPHPGRQRLRGPRRGRARPVVLDDVDHADVLNPILREKGIKSLLGVPLLVGGEVLGVSTSARSRRAVRRRRHRAAAARGRPGRDRDRARAPLRGRARRAPAARERAGGHRRGARAARARRAAQRAAAADPRHPRAPTRAPCCSSTRRRRARRARGGRDRGGGRAGRAHPGRARASPAGSRRSAGRWCSTSSTTRTSQPDPAREGDQVDARRAAARRAARSLGVLHVGTLTPRLFTRDEVELLQLVAERVALAIERARLHEETLLLDQLKLNFVAIASHELRTPARRCTACSATLVERGDELTEELREELLRVGVEQGERLRRLLEELLDLSRLDARAIDVEPRPLVLQARPRRDRRRTRCRTRAVELDVPRRPRRGRRPAGARPRRLEPRSSTRCATAQPPIGVSARAARQASAHRRRGRGPGVADGARPASSSGSRAASGVTGSGLGLAIARAYARAHGGDLVYDPRPTARASSCSCRRSGTG